MSVWISKHIYWFLVCVIITRLLFARTVCCRSMSTQFEYGGPRWKRQFDLTFAAEHDDKKDDTELVLEAIANLWSSSDGKTQIEGSAKVVHQSHSFNDGNNHYSARLRLHHDYNTKKQSTNNVKNCLDLSSMC